MSVSATATVWPNANAPKTRCDRLNLDYRFFQNINLHENWADFNTNHVMNRQWKNNSKIKMWNCFHYSLPYKILHRLQAGILSSGVTRFPKTFLWLTHCARVFLHNLTMMGSGLSQTPSLVGCAAVHSTASTASSTRADLDSSVRVLQSQPARNFSDEREMV